MSVCAQSLVQPLERLEYGKPCESVGGPILKGTECRPLGLTAGWPGALTDICHPAALGIGSPLAAIAAADHFGHATVVRPVLVDGVIGQTAYRLRRRAEEGEGTGGRKYWLGRYLFSAQALGLSAAARALDETPLVAFVDSETQAAKVPVPAAAPVRTFDEVFLRSAISFCISGIPIGIHPPFDEDEFFAWASLLVSCLPGSCSRCFLLAGAWGAIWRPRCTVRRRSGLPRRSLSTGRT